MLLDRGTGIVQRPTVSDSLAALSGGSAVQVVGQGLLHIILREADPFNRLSVGVAGPDGVAHVCREVAEELHDFAGPGAAAARAPVSRRVARARASARSCAVCGSSATTLQPVPVLVLWRGWDRHHRDDLLPLGHPLPAGPRQPLHQLVAQLSPALRTATHARKLALPLCPHRYRRDGKRRRVSPRGASTLTGGTAQCWQTGQNPASCGRRGGWPGPGTR